MTGDETRHPDYAEVVRERFGVDAARERYAEQDRDLLRFLAAAVELDADPCAGGRCSDPERHAEGGHDV